MDPESNELQQFGVALFNRYGKTMSLLVDGKKVNGCWGTKSNRQDIMYILDLEVVQVAFSSWDRSLFLDCLR